MTYAAAEDIYKQLSFVKRGLIQETIKCVKNGPPYEKYTESEMNVYHSLTEEERTVFYFIIGLIVTNPEKYTLQDHLFMSMLENHS